jgi:hypothetical protein
VPQHALVSDKRFILIFVYPAPKYEPAKFDKNFPKPGFSCNKFAVRITFGFKIVKCSLISFTLTHAIQIIFIAVSDYATAA